MKLIEHHAFSWNGSGYDIRVLGDGKSLTIAVFADNRPATGLRYQVQVPSYADPERIIATDAFTELIEHAREDIRTGCWERLLERT